MPRKMLAQTLNIVLAHWLTVRLLHMLRPLVDSVPGWQLPLSWLIQSDHLLIADCMIPPFGQEHSWKAGPGEVMHLQ